jgi:purine-binding chemotaxis protein CheW
LRVLYAGRDFTRQQSTRAATTLYRATIMSEQTTTASAQKDESQLVTFYLGEEEFGFDIMSVQEIIRQPKLSRIPMSPAYVEGVANLRGMILPIIDTRTRFGMARVEDTDRTRVLVVDVDGNKTGLRVDRVRQVTRVLQQQMEPPPPVIREGMHSDYLASVVKLDEGKRIIMALNPKAICKVSQEGLEKRVTTQIEISATSDQAKDSTEDLSVTQLVTFKLGLEEFAFQMERVREILRVQRPNEVPGTPKHVLGVLTVRGNILPVIDLRVMLGLSSLESEVVAEATDLCARFKAWLSAAVETVRSGATKLDASGAETVRKWMAECNTSSQALMDILSKMRTANDRLLRGVAQTQSLIASEPAKAPEHFQQEAATSAQLVIQLLEEFQNSVKENIREDQRLIVVQTGGSLLALLVDKVREVLNMPKRQIDPPPQNLSETKNVELSGIAKLENGKRLILLLDADHLINDQELQKLGVASESSANESQQHQVGEVSAALGEQQFVTFRLGDGEFGIPIAKIQEIDRSSKMTRVPRTADYVDGITNLRGEVVPVINARKRFNLPQKEADERTRVIIMELGGVKTGLLVDSVREVLNLATKDISAPPTSLSTTIDRQYISGIGKVDGDKRMIVLLDVEKILQR